MFGVIGKGYDSNYEYVINGVEAACETHNVKRKDGDRASSVFVDTNWIVSFDKDGSSLGIHEDDKTNNTIAKADENVVELFDEFVQTNYYCEDDYSEEKINFIKEYKGYNFEYEFLYNGELIAKDGAIDYKAIDERFGGYIYLTLVITMKDSAGKVLYKSNDDDSNSYGFIYIVSPNVK